MEEIQVCIYNELLNIKKLTSDIYSNLLIKYGEENVNFVIDKMIDLEIEGSNKFDYYISRILTYDDINGFDNAMDAYFNDLNLTERLTPEENVILATEIHQIINQLNDLLDKTMIEFERGVWLDDRILQCISECKDINLVEEIKDLYNKFICKRNILVEANLKLVITVSKHFYKNGIDINDLVQYGNLGLMRAIEKYNPKFNTNLSTYSYYWIKQSITRNIPCLQSSFQTSYHFFSLNLLMKKYIRDYVNENCCEPTNKEIAEELNISVEKAIEIKMMFLEPFSIYSPASVFNNADGEMKFIDVIEDKSSLVEERVFMEELSTELNKILKDNLSLQEYYVISHRYGFNNCDIMTLEQLSKKMGISREGVRQIERKVIDKKLKKKCKNLHVYLT